MANGCRGAVTIALLVSLTSLSADPSRAQPVPLTGVTDLAVGETHACVALQSGGAMCWGGGGGPALRLGRATSGRAAAPVDLLPQQLSDVAAGYVSCAVTSAGALFCWGHNSSHVLGTQGGDTAVPTPVVGFANGGVARVSTGSLHTCAITTAGAVVCWGDNSHGQVGDGTLNVRPTPVAVTGLSAGATAIDLGSTFSCAIVSGAAHCWGEGASGQLGDGIAAMRTTPVQVSTLTSGVVAIAAGTAHACAITSAGAVKCWGENGWGQLGDGTSTQRNVPVDVLGLSSGVIAIAAGFRHSCAVRNDGSVWCWGDNDFGQLGDGTQFDRAVAVPVVGLAGTAVQVGTGFDQTCVRLSDSTVRCFGVNHQDELGNNTMVYRDTPVAVLAPTLATIDAGAAHTCGITLGGAALCWGDNESGELGDETFVPRALPQAVAAHSSGVARVAAGGDLSCSLSTAGGVRCWGGSLPAPVDVVGLASGALAVDVGGSHICAIAAGGVAKCWGLNGAGQLGTGDQLDRNDPADVAGIASGVASIALGAAHSCALRAGGIKCWGSNLYGQLGDGTTITLRTSPVDVAGLQSGVDSIVAGAWHTCAIDNGETFCWGWNFRGQLGYSTPGVGSNVPLRVPGMSTGVTALAAGDMHTCGLRGGLVYCWGDNEMGQLGDAFGGFGGSLPVPVALPATALAIGAGAFHTCALLQGGETRCWGQAFRGALGNGDTTLSVQPVQVLVGDFDPRIELTTSPNPSNEGGLVTISARVTTVDGSVSGNVYIRDGPGREICSAALISNTVLCQEPLTPGVHTIEARYEPFGGPPIFGFAPGALPGSVSVQHVVNRAPLHHCGGFNDVLSPGNPFCQNVEWVRNRSITFGCGTLDYCPDVAVSRVAMAAFTNRLGRAITPMIMTGSAFPSSLDGAACSLNHTPRPTIRGARTSTLSFPAGLMQTSSSQRVSTSTFWKTSRSTS